MPQRGTAREPYYKHRLKQPARAVRRSGKHTATEKREARRSGPSSLIGDFRDKERQSGTMTEEAARQYGTLAHVSNGADVNCRRNSGGHARAAETGKLDARQRLPLRNGWPYTRNA